MSDGLDRNKLIGFGIGCVCFGTPWVECSIDMDHYEKIMGYRLGPRRFYGLVIGNFMVGFWARPRRIYRDAV